MNITRNNYEIYFLDYWEKRLLPDQVAELLLFLEQNPDLKQEFGDFNNITLTPDNTITFEEKESLKKYEVNEVAPIKASNYEYYFIAELEGDLPIEESLLLKTFLDKNPSLKKTFNEYKQTHLTVDSSEIFTDKKDLKKFTINSRRTSSLYYSISLAASLLILTGMFFFFNTSSRYTSPELKNIASNNTIKEPLVSKNLVAANKVSKSIKHQEPQQALAEPTKESLPEIINREKIEPIQQIASTQIASKENEHVISDNRDEFTSIYDFLKLRDETMLAENEPPTNTLKSEAINRLRKPVEQIKNETAISNVSLWDIAAKGLEGLGKLTDNDIQLNREIGQDGKTTSYDLAVNDFQYSRSFKKE